MPTLLIPDDFSLEEFVKFSSFNSCEDLTIDFEASNFVYPSGLIPLVNLAKQVTNKGYRVNIVNESSDLKSYLARMDFYQCIGHKVNAQNRNTPANRFVEIYSFDKGVGDNELMHKGTEIVSCLSKEIPSEHRYNVGQALAFCISEIIDNAKVHSKADEICLMAQNYPQKGFVEFCVADNGIGMRESLQTKTTEEALINSINHSVKGTESPGAGNGLYLSSQMIRNGESAKSELLLYSERRYLDISENELFLHQSLLDWQGTVVVLRVAYDISGDFEKTMGYDPPSLISYD